jgi:hypothetical protein
MSFTLADAASLTQDMLLKGVINTLITESEVLRYLPFLTVNGSAVTYNRESTPSTASFYGVGDTWTEDVLTVAPVSAALTVLGGDADVDAFLQQTYNNPNDMEAIALENKAKAIAYTFNDTFFHGDTLASGNQFDGLNRICGAIATTGGFTNAVRALSHGVNGATLTLPHIDELVDAIKPGKPGVLFMSKRSRRKLLALRRASGVLETTLDQFGRQVMAYNGVPIAVDDNITDAETQGANNDCSSIYAVQFGMQTGIMGLQNGGIQVVNLGEMEAKNARRRRIKWYCGLACFRTLAVARLAGVRD